MTDCISVTEKDSLSNFYRRYPKWVGEDSDGFQSDFSPHIFGPYRGDCEDILLSISSYLRENNYQGASICSEIPNHDVPDTMGYGQQNWWESINFMYHADAAVFVFLEPLDSRLNDRSAQGLNSSVIAELVFWSHFFADSRAGTLVLFEGDLADSLGSLVTGVIEANGIESQQVDTNDIDTMKETILTSCMDWLCEV